MVVVDLQQRSEGLVGEVLDGPGAVLIVVEHLLADQVAQLFVLVDPVPAGPVG